MRGIRSWKLLGMLSVVVIMLIVIGGCSKEEVKETKKTEPVAQEEAKPKLRIMAHSEEFFNQQYGGYLAIKYPELEYELVTTESIRSDTSPEKAPGDKLISLIEKENPDLILLNPEEVIPLVDKGKLLSLEPMMEQSQFDTNGIDPAIMDYFRKLGNGAMYALSPSYNTSVVYYNKSMFKENGIEEPKDQMTWEELYNLGARIAQLGTEEKPMYGLSDSFFPRLQDSILQVASTYGLRIIDARQEKILFDAEGWQKVYQTVADAIQSKALHMVKEEVSMRSSSENPFTQQEIGMQVGGLVSANGIKGNASFEVGVITMPVDPARPDVSPFVTFGSLYGIHAQSAQQEEAWKVLSYLMSEEVANKLALTSQLPVRNMGLKNISDWDAAPFTRLKPATDTKFIWDLIPNVYPNQGEEMARAMTDILERDVPVKDALANMQQVLQKKLDQARAEQ
ncbi:ABC transporter substrate-binding protein [Paenibacillus sp. 1001270B_150601_E10]|uniref:ABC transporter substrate-binding protein n=1 Tax=Paenibacillus sp. 1001270B_150601_E10 TaxID=2787079 RepID=UPI00189CE660|nr:extracellular solute-binding protein [Paenibacillus sp. 1001270B_150601_E10]